MYRSCIYCHADLGGNSVIRAFPVGGRLAFDVARGRLWVVCRFCARWNLSPLESRWEAIEECEDRFSGMRRRVATESISLAWSPEGVELVRIGERSGAREMAAWRYGRSLLRRRLRRVPVVLGAVGVGGLAASAFLGGVFAGLYVLLYGAVVLQPLASPDPQRVVTEVRLGSGAMLSLTRADVRTLTIAATRSGGYLAHLPRFVGRRGTALVGRADSERIFRAVLPVVNPYGGSERRIAAAAGLLEDAGDPGRYLSLLAERKATVAALGREARLAFEMALHEQTERAALEGEMRALETAWREAEELARVADTLALPGWLAERVDRLRARRDRPGRGRR